MGRTLTLGTESEVVLSAQVTEDYFAVLGVPAALGRTFTTEETRIALFQQSVTAEKTRGDALSRRFEEALKQASQEPITRPMRDFDLD